MKCCVDYSKIFPRVLSFSALEGSLICVHSHQPKRKTKSNSYENEFTADCTACYK